MTVDEKKLLASISLFAGVPDEELDVILQRCNRRTFERNTIILNEGDESNAMYIIKSGRVKVHLSDENGKELIINNLGAGDYFGELALLDNEPRSASVMTQQKSSFLVLHSDDFQDIMQRNPVVTQVLLRNMVSRVRSLTDNIKNLAMLDVYGRVAKTLLGMAAQQDGKLIIDSGLTQQDIANRVGASREMVAKIMKDLATGGYISYDRREIVINERLPEHY